MRRNTKRITALLLMLVMAATMSTGTALADEPAPLNVDATEEVMWEEDPLEEIDLQEESEQEDIQEDISDEADQIQAASLSLRGNGTAADPYQIYTETELRSLAVKDRDVLSKHYILMNDITLSGTENNWTPIGIWASGTSNKYPFTGVFDGNGHTISNIQITRNESYQGMFGYTSNAEIRNLTISESSILGTGYTGNIIGYFMSSTIQNCHSDAVMRNEKGGTVGGLIGYAGSNSYISDCTFSGMVEAAGTSTSKTMGGIVGRAQTIDIVHCTNYGLISNLGSPGTYIGGIAGELQVSGNIENCRNYGEILSGNKGASGGIVGQASSLNQYNATIKNCINEGDVSGRGNTGGILGKANTGNPFLYQNTNTGSVAGPYETGGILGYVYAKVDVVDCINSGDIVGSGGIVGYTHSTQAEKNIVNCLNAGTVDATGTIGGIAGAPAAKDALNIKTCVVASEWIASSPFAMGSRIVPGTKAVMKSNYAYEGTLILSQTVTGEHNDMHGADATMAQLTSQRFYESLGWDFTDVWTMSGTSPYPVLQHAARSDQDLIALMDYGLTYRQALALSTPKRKLILNEVRVNHLSRAQIVSLAEGLLEPIKEDNIEKMHEELGKPSDQAQQSTESALPFRYEGLSPEEIGQIESGAETDSIQPYIFPLPPRNSVDSSDQTGTYFKVVADMSYTSATAHAVLPQIVNYCDIDRPYMMMTLNNLTNTLKVSILGDYSIVYMDGAWYPHYTLGLWDPELVNEDGTPGGYRYKNIAQYDTPIEADEVFFNVEIIKDGELSAVEYRLFDGQYNLLYSMKAQFPADEMKPDGSNVRIERTISLAQHYINSLDTNTGTTMLNAKFDRSSLYRFGNFRDWGIYETFDVLRQAPSEQQLSTVVINNYKQWDAEDITISFTIPNP